jgi:hypothetical protein
MVVDLSLFGAFLLQYFKPRRRLALQLESWSEAIYGIILEGKRVDLLEAVENI